MRRRLLRGLIPGLGLLAGLFIWLYVIAGLKEYLQAMWEINRLPGNQAAKSWDDFFTLNEPNLYGGILAGFLGDKIWIWGRSGLRFFQPDEDTVYSFFSACTPEILSAIQEGQERFSMDRSVESDIGIWKTRVKKGDYVTAAIAAEGAGGIAGHLREIYGYDWWVFMPGDLKHWTLDKLNRPCR